MHKPGASMGGMDNGSGGSGGAGRAPSARAPSLPIRVLAHTQGIVTWLVALAILFPPSLSPSSSSTAAPAQISSIGQLRALDGAGWRVLLNRPLPLVPASLASVGAASLAPFCCWTRLHAAYFAGASVCCSFTAKALKRVIRQPRPAELQAQSTAAAGKSKKRKKERGGPREISGMPSTHSS